MVAKQVCFAFENPFKHMKMAQQLVNVKVEMMPSTVFYTLIMQNDRFIDRTDLAFYGYDFYSFPSIKCNIFLWINVKVGLLNCDTFKALYKCF